MTKNNIDLTYITKARATYIRYIQHLQNDQDKTAAVKAFEYCYELSWKLMKRIVESRGLDAQSPRDAFRKAALIKLIDDPTVWFEFQDRRNLSSHTYNFDTLEHIVEIFDEFLEHMNLLIARVKEINALHEI